MFLIYSLDFLLPLEIGIGDPATVFEVSQLTASGAKKITVSYTIPPFTAAFWSPFASLTAAPFSTLPAALGIGCGAVPW